MKGKIMEENQIQIGTQVPETQFQEPVVSENSEVSQFEKTETLSVQNDDERQSLDALSQEKDLSENRILGKFKNVDELAKAYSELQKLQGQNSQELGQLRQESNSTNGLIGSLVELLTMRDGYSEVLDEVKSKYNQPEYFQDTAFRDLYKEAFMALNGNIDSDKFINLLESYVKSRLNIYEKNKLADAETQKVLSSMTYSKNPKDTFTPPKKSLDEMTSQEIDDLIERLI